MSRTEMEEQETHRFLLIKVLKFLTQAKEIYDSYYRSAPKGICSILAESAKHPLPTSYPIESEDTAELNAEIQIVADHLRYTAGKRIADTSQVWFRDPKTAAFYHAITKEILTEDESNDSIESKAIHP
ncbi:MAG: hypothetical protein P1U63_01635 [Coxiellaceae bacterium]|nr:hypothetical protein [Coxiellaceae bacterium]